MAVYYNENNKFNAQWLHELIREGAIAPGDVDESSIEDVAPGTRSVTFLQALERGRTLCVERRTTGKCGQEVVLANLTARQAKEAADERNLWPSFYHLISQCRPITVFGEQVGNKNSLPRHCSL